ncbi:MAG: hypothetical protein SCH98_16310 [Deferrisomatales bacterium]|nr:hypothetical protein [Deferrisomatales bacterium]
MDPKLLESWLRLTADALRGTEEARRALEALGARPPTADALNAWARAWLPKESAPAADPGDLRQLVEEYWKALGVVPRQSYLELLERCEELKTRLEEAEATVKNLRELLASRGREPEAQRAIGEWEQLTKKALQAQADWARNWAEGFVEGAEKKRRT